MAIETEGSVSGRVLCGGFGPTEVLEASILAEPVEGVSYIAVDAENGETLRALILGGDLNMRPNLISLKLAHVRFVGHWNANNTVFDLLKPVSSLTELTLDCVAFEDDLFERLLMTASLPNLKVLTLLHLPRPPQEILHLDDFVQARGIDLTTTQLDDS
ncbi:hypothetical protein NMY22_g11678 [Coprinellus aureogranulatus]|nr:hypothetical protein NMY22_g11678 [Coprinellus aureogranulatus]